MFFHKKQPAPAPPAPQPAAATDAGDSASWMETVLLNVAEGICVITRDGSITFANEAFAVLVHEQRATLPNQPVWKYMYLTNKDNQPLTISTVEKAWSTDGARALNGTYHYQSQIIDLIAQYVPDIDQMVLVTRDVSEAEEARISAAEAAEHLRLEQTRIQEIVAKDEAMLRSIGDALIATDELGNVIFANPSAERLFGLDEAKMTGKQLIDVLPFMNDNSRIIAREDRLLTRALATGQPQATNDKAHSFYLHPNGHKISISITITPILLKDKLIGTITIYRDVTHAQEVDRMKTEFISLASHQLRTPLSAIKWFSEMLLAGDAGALNGDQLDFTKNICQSTDRMIQLVNSLLNISRLESGRIIIDPKPTDLKELVDSVIKELHNAIEEKHQTLIVSVHDQLPKIALDQRLIEQVYLNLLTNAVKYTPVGGEITVIISANNDSIVSQVSDNGLGIPHSQQAKLFQKFFRAENAVKIETDGNGLGLYLVKAIVESSSGKVWFKSDEGKGSSFWFSLPKAGMKAQEGEVMLETAHQEDLKPSEEKSPAA